VKKQIFVAAAAIVAAAGLVGLKRADSTARIGAGYIAKVACSEIFLAGRPTDAVLADDFNDISPLLDLVGISVDANAKAVTASLYGLGRSKATYRTGYGCTLESGGAPEQLPPPPAFGDAPLPDALNGENSQIDYAALNRILDAALSDDAAAHRAILVVVDGRVVAERYAQGFSAETPFLSWSMAKSLTATMVGAANLQGLIEIDAPAPVKEWGDGDERAAITWNDLLQMQSGLAFEEDYADPLSDVNRMLFATRDAGSIAAGKPAIFEPGKHWAYSSGTTNLIQRTLRQVLGEHNVSYHSFARDRLFAPLGAASFTLEPDSSGNFIGSSFVYATTRDWAKLGLLYLDDGVWNGERLLPEGWTDYVKAPAAASDHFYGAQFWLNFDGADGRIRYMPGIPESAFLMAGHEGQYVLMAPDKNLVIVRTGMTRGREPMPIVAPVFSAIYDAIAK
jgi:CubicO group peptidase (beta-lactamase class C family)